MPRLILLASCLLLNLCGCAQWKTPDAETVDLPVPKMAPDSVVLEIAVARVPSDIEDIEAALWQRVDEQHLPIDLRRRLSENGIRCALLGSQTPESLWKILESDELEFADGPESATRRKGEGTWREKKQSRAGKRYKIVTTPVRDRLDVMTKEDGVVQGKTCKQAHCELALRSFPLGDGSVRLELTPEIHYGPPRQTYVGDRDGFVIEAKQDELVFEQLRIESVLSPGQTLLISCTKDLAGLGRHFFATSTAEAAAPKLVLIRVAQTQYDDLFDPENVLAPIATATD